MKRRRSSPPVCTESSAFAGHRFPSEVILLAVRWYLRFGLSYRDLEELHRLEVRARLDPSDAEELLQRATENGSARYRAFALGHLGRRDEAEATAMTTGSDLLVAHVAPAGPAGAARDRLAQRLQPGLREAFLAGGACGADERR